MLVAFLCGGTLRRFGPAVVGRPKLFTPPVCAVDRHAVLDGSQALDAVSCTTIASGLVHHSDCRGDAGDRSTGAELFLLRTSLIVLVGGQNCDGC